MNTKQKIIYNLKKEFYDESFKLCLYSYIPKERNKITKKMKKIIYNGKLLGMTDEDFDKIMKKAYRKYSE